MLLHTRGEPTSACTRRSTRREIARTSRLVSRLTGYVVQPNKAIVGRNAFAHESGIHQDGVLKERTTYEIMDATTVGLDANSLVLGKHSGRHALRQALEELGFTVEGQALNTAFKRFKEIADKKKQVTAMDLEALVTDELREELAGYTLESFDVEASSRRPPHATVAVRMPDGERAQRRVHRRRPDRRGLPRDQRRDRHRRAAARVPRRRGHRGPGRARRGLRRGRARRAERRGPGRLDRHHRGRGARLPARARRSRREGRARRGAEAEARAARAAARRRRELGPRRHTVYVITYVCTWPWRAGTQPDERALSIGPRVRALREAEGLSLRDLAQRSRRQRGDALARSSAARRARRSQVAARIAAGLELRLSQLLRLDEGGTVTIVRAGERRARRLAAPRAPLSRC